MDDENKAVAAGIIEVDIGPVNVADAGTAMVEFTRGEIIAEDEVPKVITEAQRQIISGEIDLEDIDIVPVGGGNFVPYVKWQKVIDILNKATRWNWEYRVDEYIGPRENEAGELECIVHGRLIIHGANGTTREYAASGGSLLKKSKDSGKPNKTMTTADYFEGAVSRMIRKAAMRFGIGLRLSDDWVTERALAYHGKTEEAGPKVREALFDKIGGDETTLRDRLAEYGIPYEGWELQSKMATKAIAKKVQAVIDGDPTRKVIQELGDDDEGLEPGEPPKRMIL